MARKNKNVLRDKTGRRICPPKRGNEVLLGAGGRKGSGEPEEDPLMEWQKPRTLTSEFEYNLRQQMVQLFKRPTPSQEAIFEEPPVSPISTYKERRRKRKEREAQEELQRELVRA